MTPALPRAALRRQARRLVQGDDVFVLPEDGSLDHTRVGLAGPGLRPGRCRRHRLSQLRASDLLSRGDAGGGVHAAAIDTVLARAAEFFLLTLRDLGEVPLQPA